MIYHIFKKSHIPNKIPAEMEELILHLKNKTDKEEFLKGEAYPLYLWGEHE